MFNVVKFLSQFVTGMICAILVLFYSLFTLLFVISFFTTSGHDQAAEVAFNGFPIVGWIYNLIKYAVSSYMDSGTAEMVALIGTIQMFVIFASSIVINLEANRRQRCYIAAKSLDIIKTAYKEGVDENAK